MSGIGHNKGPTIEAGKSWRKHCWTKARRELLPTLPIEIVRRRVARAKELGLDYKSYASIRAASGHDVVAFLFSSNALRVSRKPPKCQRTGCGNWLMSPIATARLPSTAR